jgi:hypothetical protein
LFSWVIAVFSFTLIVSERLSPGNHKVLYYRKPEGLVVVGLVWFGYLTSFTFFSSEHCVLTWTEKGIYIFIPQNVQVLLWSEVKGNYIFLSKVT